jgi:predicted dehydrogenase
MLAYAGGAVGFVHVSTVEAGTPRHLQLVGDRATLDLTEDELTITQFTPALSTYRRESPELFGEPAAVTRRIDVPPSLSFGEGHARAHRDFYDAILGGGTPRCPGSSGRMSLELANAITLSSCMGRTVPLPLDRQAYSTLLTDLRAGRQRIQGAVTTHE